ncbi:MAG: hypothetical protein E3J35_04625 [Methanomassiliicoccales archaeon]|nr:MAG: hypothetical protein E3J35_04625 [Methanomassiliicoccales archaeon]
MKGVLIAWTLPDVDKTRTSTLSKGLYGQETSSHGGKYIYWRKGLLDDIPYVKLIRGVVIVKEKDSKRVVEFLKGYDAKVHVREVTLSRRDERTLSTRKLPS